MAVMADTHFLAELCSDRVGLLDRFLARRCQLLRSVDGGLPGELEAVQRGISWLRDRDIAGVSGSFGHAARCDTMRHSEDEVRR